MVGCLWNALTGTIEGGVGNEQATVSSAPGGAFTPTSRLQGPGVPLCVIITRRRPGLPQVPGPMLAEKEAEK